MYERTAVVLVNYPFISDTGLQQKVRPALVVSDHTTSRRFPDDVMLAAITSRPIDDLTPNEVQISADNPDFALTGLRTTSVVRLDFVMTVPADVIHKVIGKLSQQQMAVVEAALNRSLGLK